MRRSNEVNKNTFTVSLEMSNALFYSHLNMNIVWDLMKISHNEMPLMDRYGACLSWHFSRYFWLVLIFLISSLALTSVQCVCVFFSRHIFIFTFQFQMSEYIINVMWCNLILLNVFFFYIYILYWNIHNRWNGNDSTIIILRNVQIVLPLENLSLQCNSLFMVFLVRSQQQNWNLSPDER